MQEKDQVGVSSTDNPTYALGSYYPPTREVLPHEQSGQGRKAYPALVLFKMTFLKTWYQLSDYGIAVYVDLVKAHGSPMLEGPS
jgi:hypothetical protein